MLGTKKKEILEGAELSTDGDRQAEVDHVIESLKSVCAKEKVELWERIGLGIMER